MNLIFDNAQSTREASAGTYKTEAAFQALIVAAIAVAVAAQETFSCTVSTSGVSNQDLQNVMKNFTASGYGCSLAVSTLTISW